MSFVNMREMELEMGSKRTRPYDETEADESNKRLKSEECIQLRLLLVGKDCGALIGKTGSNIQRLRDEGSFS